MPAPDDASALGRPRLAAGAGYRWRRAPHRRAYRPSPFHGFFGGLLKALGIAYLAHPLFGWGAGGSPFGLLLLAAAILWLATRRRRRPAHW